MNHATTTQHQAHSAATPEILIPLECLLCPAEGWSVDGTLPGWTLTLDMAGDLSDLCPRCSPTTP